MKGDFTYPMWFSKPAKELLGMIMRTDPKQRATIAQIKESAWYREGGFTEDELRNEAGTSLDPVIDDVEFGEAKDEGEDVDPNHLNPQKCAARERARARLHARHGPGRARAARRLPSAHRRGARSPWHLHQRACSPLTA